MAGNTPGGTARKASSSTTSGSAKRTVSGVLMTNAATKTMQDAKDLLIDTDYCNSDEAFDAGGIARIVRRLVNVVKTKGLQDAVKAVADVIEGVARQRMARDITELVKEEMREMMEGMQGMVKRVEEMGTKTMEAVSETQAKSYAAAAGERNTPARVTAILNRQDMRSRQIVIQRTAGVSSEDYDLSKLSESELLEKAKIALDGVKGMKECPSDIKFLGARRLRGGDVTLLMGSAESRLWLSQTLATEAFMAGFHCMSKVRTPMLTVVAEYVATRFAPGDQGSLRLIEQSAGLQEKSIKSASWIKPEERRSASQQYAHMKMKFTDRQQVNKAIWDGIFIEGKFITVRKDIQEPVICYKCHSVGDGHYANNCT
ncbi:hypothetical protein BDN71DRAFT_1511091 [Pleurotus eryngii]|uniref:Uncharacterized protein n=1 Tax=Pleurotus eryngii TaxID=5323 RepID=A0A9P5ZMV1_PLEER|nr:hypothetical protein BDN71DRAFT_1511091 [Pleurotus eryngii]